jgi:hypothetical protein
LPGAEGEEVPFTDVDYYTTVLSDLEDYEGSVFAGGRLYNKDLISTLPSELSSRAT